MGSLFVVAAKAATQKALVVDWVRRVYVVSLDSGFRRNDGDVGHH